ncbi:MAG: DUF47 domain-containing protein [Halanaerobiaceae bacterium]
MFWKDNNKVQDLYFKHLEKVDECLAVFTETIKLYINNGETEEVNSMAIKVHKLETEADTTRREIIHLLIEKSYLLPNTRKDFLSLLEDIDKVADFSEAVLDYILLQDMDITNIGKQKIEELLELTKKQFDLLKKAVKYLFEDIEKAFSLVIEIDKLESDVDNIERNLISRLSKQRDDLDLSLKILYRDFITMVANISDMIEDAGDEIEIIIALRKV